MNLFYTLGRGWLVGKKKTNLMVDLLYPLTRLACGYIKKQRRKLRCFYTPKRFRTAVAGMKIPSPGPLDDRGV